MRLAVSRDLDEPLSRRGLSRAAFLRLVGSGAALSFGAGSFASLAARPSVAQTVGPDILSPEGEFPIGIWWPPPPRETTAARYAEVSAAGFNLVIGGNGVNSTDLHRRALDAAAANGLRYLISDNILHNAMRGEVSPDLQEAVSQRLQRLIEDHGTHPALAGVNLFEEPSTRVFDILAYALRELRRLAPQELPYINIVPSYTGQSSLGAQTYEGYLDRYFTKVGPPMVSFDHYPLLERGITPDYFSNWAQIRSLALRFGVPCWALVQSVGFVESKGNLPRRRTPTQAELFWQTNVSLAYGAKGLQYFTYWTPEDNPKTRFGSAMVTREGRPTPLYQYARNVNAQLRVFGRALLPLTSESVVHARMRRLPRGARAFRPDSYVRSVAGSPLILSRFRDPAIAGERHVFVANHSSANGAASRLALSNVVREVHEIDRTSGRRVPADLRGTRELRIAIEPGRARLFVLRTG